MTRGKRLVVIVGQKRALAMAVRSGEAGRRWSRLKEWLAAVTKRRLGAERARGSDAIAFVRGGGKPVRLRQSGRLRGAQRLQQ